MASTTRPGITNNSPQYDPSASGTPTINTTFPKYIGWRTMEYTPVVTTFWSDSTLIFAAAYPFWIVVIIVMRSPTATKTSPTTETAAGTEDQPKRKSNALTTIIAAIERNANVMMIFCKSLVSAAGPACIRRLSAAGFVAAR